MPDTKVPETVSKEELLEVLKRIVDRYERDEAATGGSPSRWGLIWAMYSDAKDAIAKAVKAEAPRRRYLVEILDPQTQATGLAAGADYNTSFHVVSEVKEETPPKRARRWVVELPNCDDPDWIAMRKNVTMIRELKPITREQIDEAINRVSTKIYNPDWNIDVLRELGIEVEG
jgi:hypothetical protein